jgi:hypothetical protein
MGIDTSYIISGGIINWADWVYLHEVWFWILTYFLSCHVQCKLLYCLFCSRSNYPYLCLWNACLLVSLEVCGKTNTLKVDRIDASRIWLIVLIRCYIKLGRIIFIEESWNTEIGEHLVIWRHLQNYNPRVPQLPVEYNE